MKERILNIIKLIVSLLLFFIIGTIATQVLSLFNINVKELSTKYNVIYQLVLSIITFLILFILYYKYIKKDYINLKKHIGKNIKQIIKYFFTFMIVKYIVSFITVLIITLMGFDINSSTSVNQNMVAEYVKTAPYIMVITTSFLAPIYEEILFRLGFKKVIKNRFLFIIISGLLFGLLHIFPLSEGITLTLGLIQSISYVTMGIFLAYIYNKSDNIWISIGVHFLNNFISVITMINMI